MEKKRLHLFEAYGVELEYMIVDQATLEVKPVSEVLLQNDSGAIAGELEFGDVAWSNELVGHVIEIKSNGPKADLVKLGQSFSTNITEINKKLDESGAALMPSAAHPWMNPSRDTRLWQHDSHDIYQLYDRIFNCKGHGWSNLQSTHINLPFYDDEEFSKLHMAIRFLMPIIPALTAASPVLNGKFTGYLDRRLYYYELNQAKIPVLTGKVIPERIYTRHGYQKHIYDRIAEAIAPHDPDHLLQPVWLNSRGAIARFDRGAIEIRIIDIQECPHADMAVVALIVHLLKLLVKGSWVPFNTQKSFETVELYQIFKSCVKDASGASIDNVNYLKALGFSAPTSGKLAWAMLLEKASEVYPDEMEHWRSAIDVMITKGTLAERIVKALGGDYSPSNLQNVYRKLTICLSSNHLFDE